MSPKERQVRYMRRIAAEEYSDIFPSFAIRCKAIEACLRGTSAA